MRHGRWLAALGRRLLRRDTYELVLSPAVADLQYESRTADSLTTARAYAGACVALMGAAGLDVRCDLGHLRKDAPHLAWLIAMQSAYHSALLVLVSVVGLSRVTAGVAVTCFAAIVVLSTMGTLVCFWPERR